MVTLGIIAEYNPFHNGHLYHLEKSRKDLQAEVVIVVLGSSFLQRGEPALLNKWDRVRMALANGCDLIIELPLAYACASAEHFAKAGIAILDSLQCNYISFGIEHDDYQDINTIAELLIKEEETLSLALKKELKNGLSYPTARAKALKIIPTIPKGVEKILKSPNNILAIEYLKGIKTMNSSLKPHFIKRQNVNYHDLNFTENMASATAIRHLLKDTSVSRLSTIKKLMPLESFNILNEALSSGSAPTFAQDLGQIILARLRCTTPKQLASLPDMENGLENRLIKASEKAYSWDELLKLLQTKRYPKTRLQRILTYFLLGLTEDYRKQIHFYNSPTYIRPLGFTKKGQAYLNKIKKASKLPLVTRIAPRQLKSHPPEVLMSLELERRATDILALLAPNPQKRLGGRDFIQAPIIYS